MVRNHITKIVKIGEVVAEATPNIQEETKAEILKEDPKDAEEVIKKNKKPVKIEPTHNQEAGTAKTTDKPIDKKQTNIGTDSSYLTDSQDKKNK